MTGLFLDTETTGIKRWDKPDFIPQLVQLGAILQDLDTGRILAEVNLVNVKGGDSREFEAVQRAYREATS